MKSNKTVIAYKGLDKDFKCRGHQYEVGKEYIHSGNIALCQSGFHACENPLDVLGYYGLINNRFARVELNGEIKKDGDKSVCSKISIVAELKLPDFIDAAIKFVWDSASKKKKDQKDGAQLASSGYGAQLASSGYGARLASSGDGAQLASSGDGAQLASSGYGAQLASSGDGAQLASSGDGAQLASSGKWARLASSGYGAQLAVADEFSVACGVERDSKVRGIKGSLVCLVHYDDKTPIKFVTGEIGKKGLKADIWYTLSKDGKFIEVEL